MGTSRRSLLAWAVAAVFLVATLQSARAQDSPPSAPPFDPNDPDAAYLFGFPFCRCSDYRCGAAPYKMLKASEETLPNGNYKVCFNFNDVGCPTNNACCTSLLQSVGKVEVQAGASRHEERACRGWGRGEEKGAAGW